MTSPCKGSAENSVGQGRWGTHVSVTKSVQHGWVWVFGSWGNQGTELKDMQAQAWCHPGPEFLPCSLVFRALLWGALRTAFLLNLLSTKKLRSQEEAETILPADFYNKNDLHPLLHFCHGKWHSGSLKMVNDPLWANACRASQLALRTSSLKTMAQVLPRPEGDCQCQRPPSQESLLQELPWKWRQRQGHTSWKAARTEAVS